MSSDIQTFFFYIKMQKKILGVIHNHFIHSEVYRFSAMMSLWANQFIIKLFNILSPVHFVKSA